MENKPLDYLKKASLRGSKLGLERITELCRLLGNPQENLKVIHVAGTNGKGSFCAMISAILQESGYKTGSFSSPALTDISDCFRINGKEVAENELDRIMAEIIPHCESMEDKPTEFEVTTALAYKLFADEKCDIAVIECGMGGDTDSTNVVASPVLSVITNISFDHTAFLGEKIQEIAAHKAGIIKKERPVLYGGNNADALGIISEKAEKNNSSLYITNHSRLSVIESDMLSKKVKFDDKEYVSHLVGEYQNYNIANVLTAVEILREQGINIPEKAVYSGISKARIHGRFEVFSMNPPVIFDGAHNPDGIIQAAESIEKYFGDKKINLLIGVMADKEYELYPKILGKYIERVYTATPDNPRALDSKTLLLTFAKYKILGATCDNLDCCIKTAIEMSLENNTPLVALGSLYMYKDFIRILSRYNLH